VKVLIVDDERLARERLARMIETLEEHEVVGQAADGRDAIVQAEATHADLILLDIRMPGMDGLETARHLASLEAPPAIIFCTAYDEHAIAAFDLQAVGYLLKPVRLEQLARAIDQSGRVNRVQLAALGSMDAADDGDTGRAGRRGHIAARTRRGLELIPVADVRYFLADQKYGTVRAEHAEVIVDDTLKELEDEFGELFVRIHRNALVSVAHIERLERAGPGQARIHMRGIGEPLEVSRRHLSSVRKLVQSL
jgi:two-component system, LytTR family, response regulator AlgR